MLRDLYEYRYFEILNSARWKMGVRALIYISWAVLTARIFAVFGVVFIGYAVAAEDEGIREWLRSSGISADSITLAVLLLTGFSRVSAEKYSQKRLKVRHYSQLNFLKTLDFSYWNIIVVYDIFPLAAAKLRECAAVCAAAVGGLLGFWALDWAFVAQALLFIAAGALAQAFVMVRNATAVRLIPVWADFVRYLAITAVLTIAGIAAAAYMQRGQSLARPAGLLLSAISSSGFAVGGFLIAVIFGLRLYRMKGSVEYPRPALNAYFPSRGPLGLGRFMVTAYVRYLGVRDGFRGVRAMHMLLAGLLLASLMYRGYLSDNVPFSEAVAKLYGTDGITKAVFFPVLIIAEAMIEFWQQKVGPNVWYRQLRFLWEQGWSTARITAVNVGFFLLPLFPAALLMVLLVYFITYNIFWIILPIVITAVCARLSAYALVDTTKPSEEGREIDIAAETVAAAVSLGGYAIFLILPSAGWPYGLFCLYTLALGGVTWWALQRKLVNCRALTLTI